VQGANDNESKASFRRPQRWAEAGRRQARATHLFPDGDRGDSGGWFQALRRYEGAKGYRVHLVPSRTQGVGGWGSWGEEQGEEDLVPSRTQGVGGWGSWGEEQGEEELVPSPVQEVGGWGHHGVRSSPSTLDQKHTQRMQHTGNGRQQSLAVR